MQIPTLIRPTIYLDMDGVLFDFDAHFEKIHGKPTAAVDDGELWRAIAARKTFFRELPLTPEARDLFQEARYVAELRGYDFKVLTALAKSDHMDMAVVKRQKLAALRDAFPKSDVPMLVGPFSADKWKHCRCSLDLLIDDRLSNVRDWTTKGGGRAIQHVTGQLAPTLTNLYAFTGA